MADEDEQESKKGQQQIAALEWRLADGRFALELAKGHWWLTEVNENDEDITKPLQLTDAQALTLVLIDRSSDRLIDCFLECIGGADEDS